jgi:hypothetical protein
VIVRISGEGQYRLAETTIDKINELDAVLEASLDGDEAGYAAALAALLDKVRTDGEHVPDEELVESDVILPSGDATADEVREMLGDEGLVPG